MKKNDTKARWCMKCGRVWYSALPSTTCKRCNIPAGQLPDLKTVHPHKRSPRYLRKLLGPR